MDITVELVAVDGRRTVPASTDLDQTCKSSISQVSTCPVLLQPASGRLLGKPPSRGLPEGLSASKERYRVALPDTVMVIVVPLEIDL